MPLELLYGVGTLALLAVLVWAVTRYRSSRAGRAQQEFQRRSAPPEKKK